MLCKICTTCVSFSSLLNYSILMEKRFCNSVSILTFFKFALTFSMLQVSSSHSLQHKKWIQKIKEWLKKLCLIRKAHKSATCYSSNILRSFSNTELSFWFPLKTIKSQLIVWLIVWKYWLVNLKQKLSWVFRPSGNIKNFRKSGL